MPEYETRPDPNTGHEEKGGYPGGPVPDGKPPIPPLFKPVITPSTTTTTPDTPQAPTTPSPESSTDQG